MKKLLILLTFLSILGCTPKKKASKPDYKFTYMCNLGGGAYTNEIIGKAEAWGQFYVIIEKSTEKKYFIPTSKCIVLQENL